MSSRVDAVKSLYAAERLERDRDLRKKLQTKAEEMNRRGLLNSSLATQAYTEIVTSELQPVADLIKETFLKVVRTSAKAPSNAEVVTIIEEADGLINHEFLNLKHTLATSALGEDREQFLKRLHESFEVPRRSAVLHLAADIATARKADRGQPKTIADYKLVVFGAGLTLIFGLLLAWQKHNYDQRDSSREQRYVRQQEIRKDLIPKLEALRLPLSDVTRASEARSLDEYQNLLSSAVQESDAAIASFSEGYDPLKMRIGADFDPSIAASLDSIGRDAQTVRDGLQRTLADVRVGMKDRSANNPGDNLTNAGYLNRRISRFEERLLVYK